MFHRYSNSFASKYLINKTTNMSRLYDTIEPSVINEEMLREAVHEQGPKEHAEMIAKDEGLDYIDITKLRLDYRSELRYFF